MAALVGMAAIFAGASHALLAAAVFAFETTLQPLGLPPLLGGCAAAFLVSSLLLRHSIMTEKIARRGVHVPRDYDADSLAGVRVSTVMTRGVVTLPASRTVVDVHAMLADTPHVRFPVVDDAGRFAGYADRRRLAEGDVTRSVDALVVDRFHATRADASLREAIDQLAIHDVGTLAVLDEDRKVVGVLTRGDVLRAHGRLLRARHAPSRHLRLGGRREKASAGT
jgi:CBS-domain-containing membrane protein